MTHYIALLDRAGDGSYGVVFPDFPGCASAGDTFEDAVREASEALAFHVQGMREDGDAIPSPRALEEIGAGEDWYDLAGSIVALVPLLPPPAKAVRVNVTLDERLLAEIDAVAKNRSAFLAEAARRALRAK